jgi:hypothetical protein
LWGNLYFCSLTFPTEIHPNFIGFLAADVPSLSQHLHLEQAVAAAPGGTAYILGWTTMLGRCAPFASRFCGVERLAALLAALPPAWMHAAWAAAAELAAGLLQPPALADALAVLLAGAWLGPVMLSTRLLRSSFSARHGAGLLASPTTTCCAAFTLRPLACWLTLQHLLLQAACCPPCLLPAAAAAGRQAVPAPCPCFLRCGCCAGRMLVAPLTPWAAC